MNPLVGILLERQYDWETLQHAELTLNVLGIPNEVKIISAHRSPELLRDYAKTAETRGIQVIIAGGGDAAALPGMLASYTLLPVLGVPVVTESLQGLDAILSMTQMPAGTAVGVSALGRAGAINAALLAAQILALQSMKIKEALIEYRAAQTKKILDYPDPRK